LISGAGIKDDCLMKYVLYTKCISPHQLPLAAEIVKLVSAQNFRYVYTEALTEERTSLGWGSDHPTWCVHSETEESRLWLENSDVCLSGIRDIALFERRSQAGLKTFYMSERWFKPPLGMLRLLHPGYFKMAYEMVRSLRAGVNTQYFPIGVWAARDMARLHGLMSGNLSCLFRTPELNCECKPGGKIVAVNAKDDTRCLNNMRMWGYFVAPSECLSLSSEAFGSIRPLRVLWVGRMLGWKRVDTLIKAIRACLDKRPAGFFLTVVGRGVKANRLRLFAQRQNLERNIAFRDSIPVAEVRKVMREHDVYVLPSNSYEGWGAVVNEALEEKMEVLGTYDAGSTATVLPKENLFCAGDWRRLASLLCCCADGKHQCSGIGLWSVRSAANTLIDMVE